MRTENECTRIDIRRVSESRARDIYREVELISGEEKIWNVHLLFFYDGRFRSR